MSWTEVIIEIAREHAEGLSDALMEAGALSVSVEDADEGTAQEKPLFGEPGMVPTEAAWDHSRVVALTDVDADQAAIVARMQEEGVHFHDQLTKPEVTEAIAAFSEKRAPDFSRFD